MARFKVVSGLDTITIIFSENGITVQSFDIPAKLGRFYIKDYIPEYILNYSKNTGLRVLFQAPVNYYCYFYSDVCSQSSNYNDVLAGEYFQLNTSTTGTNPVDITSYFTSSDVNFVIDVHRYPNNTFVANCVNSSPGTLLQPPKNYGGVNQEICGSYYNNDNLKPEYPLTSVGKVPVIPDPTYSSGCNNDDENRSNWNWLWITLVFVGVIIIVIIVATLVRYLGSTVKTKRVKIDEDGNEVSTESSIVESDDMTYDRY